MLSSEIINHLENKLSALVDDMVSVVSATPVSGGDINAAYRLSTNGHTYFVKTNRASRFPLMFKKEAKGLELLRSTGVIKIPEVICYGEENDISYLVLEWIESGPSDHNFWETFGKQMAQLHQSSSDYFGLNESNCIGSLHQSNKQHSSWGDFFIQERLQPQIKLALDAGRLDQRTVQLFEKLFKELPDLFPAEHAALLHGDLWSGNFMTGQAGEPVIMDPAVYYGHREMDIAMTKLFGGFDSMFYTTYHQEYPLENNWEQRLTICNLYPLMVHVNLFGGSYLQQVKNILSAFKK